MTDRILIILAKSIKKGGHCIAGKELIEAGNGTQVGNWIRPVTADRDSHGAVFDGDCRLSGNGYAQVLDIVRISLGDEEPEPGQPENILIQSGQRWQKLSEFDSLRLSNLEDKPDDLWLEDGVGKNVVSDHCGVNVDASLYLIKTTNLHIILSKEWNDFKQKYHQKISAEFEYNNVLYEQFSITDPKVRRMLKNQYPGEGENPNRIRLRKGDNYYLCVSLSPSFGDAGYHYKLVATILDFDGYLQQHY